MSKEILKKINRITKLGSEPMVELSEVVEESKNDVIDTIANNEQVIKETLDSVNQTISNLSEKIDSKIDSLDIPNPIDTSDKLNEILEAVKKNENIELEITPELREKLKGDDYVLTEEDKKQIASLINVPIVEKVIEKTEVIKETPIIKEVAINESPEDIRNKLESLDGDERLQREAIRGLDDYEEISRLAREPKKVFKGNGGGARQFIQLNDVPSSYTGQALKALRVKSTEDGLEFFTGSGLIEWGEIGGTLSNQTDLQSALDLKVPYTGATGNVNLGTYGLLLGDITLADVVGNRTILWNNTSGGGTLRLRSEDLTVNNGNSGPSYEEYWGKGADGDGVNPATSAGQNLIYLGAGGDHGGFDGNGGGAMTYQIIGGTGGDAQGTAGETGGSGSSFIFTLGHGGLNADGLTRGSDGTFLIQSSSALNGNYFRIANGVSDWLTVNSSGQTLFGANVYLSATNRKLFFGASNQASIYHNSANLIIDPRESGAGTVVIGTGNGAVSIEPWSTNNAVWIKMPTTGPSAIGTGGAGTNPWIAYVSNNTEWFSDSTAGDVAYRNTLGKLLFGNTGGATAMSVSGDNIGIGNAAPKTKFYLGGNNVTNSPIGAITFGRYWASDSDTRASSIFHYYDSTAATDRLAFGVSSDTQPNAINKVKMVLDENGRLGVNTTAPVQNLHVAGGGLFTGTRTTSGTGLFLSYGSLAANTSGIESVSWGNNYTDLMIDSANTIFRNSVSATTESARITSGGRIGIGTTAPDKIVEINLGTSDALRLTYNDANGSAATYFDTTLSSTGVVTFDAVGSATQFKFVDDILSDSTTKHLFRDSAIGIYSQADTFLDLFADGAVRIGNSSAGAPTTYMAVEPTGDTYWVGVGSGKPYGSMYIYNLGAGATTITVSVVDTWYEIATGVSAGETNLMTFQNNHELLVTKAGKYKIVWNLAVSDGGNQEVEGTIMVNGTANTALAGMTETQAANKSYPLGGTGIVSLSANDVVSMAVLNHTGTNNITIDHLTLSIEMVGG